MSALQRIGF